MIEEKLLTVFTPTYNRKHTLGLGYESLRRQTSKNFKWLIIDDGSTDGTEGIVRKWQEENKDFEICYVYKENGGLHTGYNYAIERIDTELCVCIDSDDYMPDNAVEQIECFWAANRSRGIAGFIARDYFTNGTRIGIDFPNKGTIHIIELFDKYGFKGDTKIVVRTELLKEVAPQPTYFNEKNFNPIYLLLLVDYKYSFALLDRNLCYVEYLEGGMSKSLFKQYVNSPNSFAALRLIYINHPHASCVYKLRNYIHLSAKIILSRNYTWFRMAPVKPLLVLCMPLGFLLQYYIRFKAK